MKIDWMDKLMVVVSSLTILLILSLFLISPYQTDFDESIQMVGAHYLQNGFGYTIPSISHDWLTTQQTWVTGWPIGFSGYLVMMNELFGCSYELSIQLFTLCAILLGVYFWCKLYVYVNGSYKSIGLFMMFLAFTLGASFTSKTTLFLWSLFPVVVYLLLQINDRKNEKYYYKTLFLISLICALLILFRFAALGLILPISLCILYYRRQHYFKIVIDGLMFALIPVTVFLSLLLINKHMAGQASSLYDTDKSHISFSMDWLMHFSTALFSNYHLSLPIISSLTIDDTKSFIFQILSCLVVGFFIKKKNDKKLTAFSILFVCFWVGNFLFLLALDMMSYAKDSVWVPTSDTRYYWHMACMPIILIIFLLKDVRFFRVVALIGCIYFCRSVIVREQVRFSESAVSYSQKNLLKELLEKKNTQHQIVLLPEMNPELNRRVFQMRQFKTIQGDFTGFNRSIQDLKAKTTTNVSIIALPGSMEKPLFNGTSLREIVADGSFEYTDLRFCKVYFKKVGPGKSIRSVK
ncbi:MAG: hypothetical protein JWO58_1316 [Chitinophagaceae bacterium]|nr:hypothetical protein [Chitinophagaceae bacterium]